MRELHSSALRDPAELPGPDVIVVRAGAKALDLLDLCHEHEARRILSGYRGLRSCSPTRNPKAVAGSDSAGAASGFIDGTIIYTVGEKGLMASADVSGTRFWVDEDLN